MLELLYFALLFHDIGKGVRGTPHHETSAALAARAMTRIGLTDEQDQDTVLELVRHHLLMSEVMTKRDLGETAVLEDFKKRVKTLERLKLLTLMTYADTVGVNPSAVTSWRKELLWRLYLGAFAIFQRDHEDNRIQADTEAECLGLATSRRERESMERFLRGFPERYLRNHTSEQVHEHFRVASRLHSGPSSGDDEPFRRTLRDRRFGLGAAVPIRLPMRRHRQLWAQH